VRGYRKIVSRPEFPRLLIIFFVAQLVLRVLYVLALVLIPSWSPVVAHRIPSLEQRLSGFGYLDWLQLGSTAVGGLFVALGVVAVPRSRRNALRMFQRSVLISIFLVQTFVFYRNQWAALPILVFNLLLLIALNFAINQETTSR
jgi:hypothetical protein